MSALSLPVLEWLSEHFPDVTLFDGFEGAILGIVERFGQEPVVLYDRLKCLAILQERDGMEYEEAAEFFDFNVAGCYAGETTPAFAVLWDPSWANATPEPPLAVSPNAPAA